MSYKCFVFSGYALTRDVDFSSHHSCRVTYSTLQHTLHFVPASLGGIIAEHLPLYFTSALLSSTNYIQTVLHHNWGIIWQVIYARPNHLVHFGRNIMSVVVDHDVWMAHPARWLVQDDHKLVIVCSAGSLIWHVHDSPSVMSNSWHFIPEFTEK